MGRKKGSKNNRNTIVNETIEPEINAAPETQSESADSGDAGNVGGDSDTDQTSNAQQDYKASLNQFDDIIDNAKSAAQNITPTGAPEKRGRKSKSEVAQEKVKVPGRLFALAVDRFLANGICIVDSFTNKQPETIIPAKWLFADDKDLDEIAPVASSAAAELGIEEYPSVVFFGLIISNQMSRFAELKAMIRQEKKRNPDFDVADIKKPTT